MGTKVILKNVRIAFAQGLFEAKAPTDGNGKAAYSATFLFAPGSQEEKDIKAAMSAEAKARWGEKAPTVYKQLVAAGRICLRNGDSKADYEGFEGNMFVAARSTTKKPTVYGPDKSVIDRDNDNAPYSGCYVRASVEIYTIDKPGEIGKRICCGLTAVQKIKDGDSFGGAAKADPNDFEETDISDTGISEEAEGLL